MLHRKCLDSSFSFFVYFEANPFPTRNMLLIIGVKTLSNVNLVSYLLSAFTAVLTFDNLKSFYQ